MVINDSDCQRVYMRNAAAELTMNYEIILYHIVYHVHRVAISEHALPFKLHKHNPLSMFVGV